VGGRYLNISLNSEHHINPFDLAPPREDESPADILRSNIVALVGLDILSQSNATNGATMFLNVKPWGERGPKDALDAIAARINGRLFGLREMLSLPSRRVQLRAMLGFSITAAVGTLGILLLYNLDVILAKHYLDPHGAGIYGSLNKIGTILYFGTLSVSQVLFPRVVEAVARNRHPVRLLLLSAGITTALGAGAIVIFAALPGLVVGVLFGARFADATRYILAVGFIGLGLSLDNLLVQFFMAVHDRAFVPILAAGCALQAVLIVVFHGSVGQIVLDVVVAIFALFAGLAVRAVILMPRLRPEMVTEPE